MSLTAERRPNPLDPYPEPRPQAEEGDELSYPPELGSDAIALAPFTDRVAYLEEGDWVEIRRAGAVVHDETDAIVTRPIAVVSASRKITG